MARADSTIDNSYMLASAERAKKSNLVKMVLDFVAGPLVQRVVDQAVEVTTGGRKTDPNIWIGWPFLSEYSLADAEGGRTAADYDKLWSEGWAVTKAVIRSMRDKTEAAGAKFVMYPYVNKMQGNPDFQNQMRVGIAQPQAGHGKARAGVSCLRRRGGHTCDQHV